MVLREYQNLGAAFLAARERAMLLAPVGAGKTVITLTAIRRALQEGLVTRVLVLAPLRVAASVWPEEAAKWAPDLRLAVAVGTRAQRDAAFYSPAQVIVTNYDNAQTLPSLLGFDAVVFDELTRLKNPSGQRFKALEKMISHIGIRWGLTGSFTSNGLEDTFGQSKIVSQALLGRSKGAFLQQYFHCINRDYQQWAPAPGSYEAVMQRIKPATFLLDPGDYSDKLPPLETVVLRCAMPDRTPYEQMKRDFVVQFPDAVAIAANAAVVVGKLAQMSSGFVYDTSTRPDPAQPGRFITTRNPVWFSRHKFDLLEGLLAENQRAPTIIAYQFQEELAELRRRYPHAITLDDDNAIARWNRGEVELLLVHPKSAQYGLNLQAGGCRMVLLSLPWSLVDYEQLIGRLHRSGQRHTVWVYILTTSDTIDERIWATLRARRSLSDLALEVLSTPDQHSTGDQS